MGKMQEICEAMFRLSCIGRIPYQYDPAGQIVGEGPIHYLVQFRNMFFIAWENCDIGTMVVNPITRFGLDELDELGAAEAWMVMHIPQNKAEVVRFREIDNAELNDMYYQMVEQAIAAPALPVMHVP